MKIYRIENEKTKHGMWYNQYGNYDPFIMNLTEGKSKQLSMEFHERYSEGGLRWYSGCHDIKLLKEWFSELDTIELLQHGYKLYEMDSTQYKKEENQVLFTREGITNKKEIELDVVWGQVVQINR